MAAARPRLWEVDFLRGLAVIAMIFYHSSWDLSQLAGWDFDVTRGGWLLFAQGIGGSFALIAGISLALAASSGGFSRRVFLKKSLRRGGLIFLLGGGISLASFLFARESWVVFGILHLLGFAIAAGAFFAHRRKGVALLGAALAFLGGWLVSGKVVEGPWLIWLGIVQEGRAMLDFYPVLPWFGATLLGIAAGELLFPRGVRRFSLPEVPGKEGICWLGGRSLLIYFLHQPVIVGLLWGVEVLG